MMRLGGWAPAAGSTAAAYAAGSTATAPQTNPAELVDPDTARRLVSEELSGSDYHPFSFLEWLLNLLFNRSSDPFNTGFHLPDGFWPAVGLTVIVVSLLLIGWAMLRRYLKTPAPEKDGNGLADLGFSSAQYARQAEDLRNSAPNEAVKAAFRSLVVELETHGVIMPSRGRTAGEVQRALARSFPEYAPAAGQAARLFDLAAYGASHSQKCHSGDVDQVLQLAEDVRARLQARASVTTGGRS